MLILEVWIGVSQHLCAPQPTVTEAHVRRALDLFTVSTMDAVKSGVTEAVVSSHHLTYSGASQRREIHGKGALWRRVHSALH